MRWSIRRGDAFSMFFCGRRGSCPIFCLKLLEYLHLPGTYCLCGSQLIASKIVSFPYLLLDGALDIAKGELRVTPARPIECVAQEAQPVGIRPEPRFIKSCGIVIRNMREAHREAVVEALGKESSYTLRFDEVQKRVSEVSLVFGR